MNHTLIIAPPGSGSMLLARELASVPPFPLGESEPDRSYIYRAANLVGEKAREAFLKPPFRAPHHTVSEAGMSGTFRKGYQWRPGEVSLAHGGTLLLDELPEFRIATLEVVRDAMSGSLELSTFSTSRTIRSLTDDAAHIIVPTRFRLICTMNPCPCGFRGHERRTCSCSDDQVKRYLGRVPEWVLKACTNVVDAQKLATLIPQLTG
jgi:magnesium chelatase family protein